MTTAVAPNPTKVDELAQEYLALKEKLLQATLAAKAVQQPLEEMADKLREMVQEHGSAHAEKSKILRGLGFEIMATFSQTVTLDDVAVEKFRKAAEDELKPKEFAQIFETLTIYRLVATASEYVRSGKLSRKLKSLFAACQVITPKTPSLTVRPVK